MEQILRHRQIWIIGLIGILSAGLINCSRIPTPSDLLPAVVEGQVVQTVIGSTGNLAEQGVSGAEIVVVKYDQNGNMHRVEADRVYTGANGHFRLSVFTHGEYDLIVRAIKGKERWQTIVTAPLTAGAKITIPPMNYQTTLASKVFLNLSDEASVSYSDILREIQVRTQDNKLSSENLVQELAHHFAEEPIVTDVVASTATSSEPTAEPVIASEQVKVPAKELQVEVKSDITISDSVKSYIADLKHNSGATQTPVRFMIRVTKDQEAVITKEEVRGATTATQHRLWSGLKTTMLQEVEMNKQNAFSGEFLLTINPG